MRRGRQNIWDDFIMNLSSPMPCFVAIHVRGVTLRITLFFCSLAEQRYDPTSAVSLTILYKCHLSMHANRCQSNARIFQAQVMLAHGGMVLQTNNNMAEKGRERTG